MDYFWIIFLGGWACVILLTINEDLINKLKKNDKYKNLQKIFECFNSILKSGAYLSGGYHYLLIILFVIIAVGELADLILDELMAQ